MTYNVGFNDKSNVVITKETFNEILEEALQIGEKKNLIVETVRKVEGENE